MPLGSGRGAPQRRVAHRAHGRERLLGRIDTVEDDAHQADVERLFHDPIGLVGLRREAREQRDVRLQIAFRLQRRLVRHPEQEGREPREVERVVLHVGVREVDRSTRGLARIRERQVAGVDEPVDRLTGRELRDDGIQMNAVLRLRRYGEEDAENRANETLHDDRS